MPDSGELIKDATPSDRILVTLILHDREIAALRDRVLQTEQDAASFKRKQEAQDSATTAMMGQLGDLVTDLKSLSAAAASRQDQDQDVQDYIKQAKQRYQDRVAKENERDRANSRRLAVLTPMVGATLLLVVSNFLSNSRSINPTLANLVLGGIGLAALLFIVYSVYHQRGGGDTSELYAVGESHDRPHHAQPTTTITTTSSKTTHTP